MQVYASYGTHYDINQSTYAFINITNRNTNKQYVGYIDQSKKKCTVTWWGKSLFKWTFYNFNDSISCKTLTAFVLKRSRNKKILCWEIDVNSCDKGVATKELHQKWMNTKDDELRPRFSSFFFSPEKNWNRNPPWIMPSSSLTRPLMWYLIV